MTSKELLRTAFMQKMLAALIAAYIFLLRATSKIQKSGTEHPQKVWDQNKPAIFAFWHGRLLLTPCIIPKGTPASVLISLHKDGRTIAYTAEWFGLNVIAGSSTRGGAQAVRSMIKATKAGQNILMTPDAPPHKVYTCAKGVAELARLTGLPVIPCAISASHGKQLKTKDRFILPRLFSTFRITYGEPLEIDRKADEAAREEFLTQIEHALLSLTQKEDTAFNHKEWSTT